MDIPDLYCPCRILSPVLTVAKRLLSKNLTTSKKEYPSSQTLHRQSQTSSVTFRAVNSHTAVQTPPASQAGRGAMSMRWLWEFGLDMPRLVWGLCRWLRPWNSPGESLCCRAGINVAMPPGAEGAARPRRLLLPSEPDTVGVSGPRGWKALAASRLIVKDMMDIPGITLVTSESRCLEISKNH